MEHLPNETLIYIFSFITRRRDIAGVSLVSHRWNMLVFAKLYHTLYLGQQTDADLIAERILSEPEDESLDSLRISSVLRRLYIDPARYGAEGEASTFPKEVISKLVHLEHLSWTFIEPPKCRITPTFKHHCPNLRSVELKIIYGSFGGNSEFQILSAHVEPTHPYLFYRGAPL